MGSCVGPLVGRGHFLGKVGGEVFVRVGSGSEGEGSDLHRMLEYLGNE